MTDHFATVSQMIDDLKSDQADQRLYSMKGLRTIAQTLGPERTRGELIPYITDYLDDDDEVLRTLAMALGTMVSEVGGVQYVSSLFELLEILCGLDEVTVRDEATTSLTNVTIAVFKAGVTAASQQTDLLELLHRMSKDDTPQRRSSVCGVLGPAFRHANHSQRVEIRGWFSQLCGDDEVMVRRAACVALGTTGTIFVEKNPKEFMGILSAMCKDPNDSVRLQTIPTGIAVCSFFSEGELSQYVTLLKSLSTDSAWRVRYMFADKLGDLVKALPPKDVSKVCVRIFKALCEDKEDEIRASVVFSLDTIMSVCSDDVKDNVLEPACNLSKDTNCHVRESLASAILKASAFSLKSGWQRHIQPAATTLIHDSDPSVRLGLLSGFSAAAKSEQSSQLAGELVPVVVELSKDPNWRVREMVIQQTPEIVARSGSVPTDDFLQVCVNALQDRVANIRDAGCKACQALVSAHGVGWAKSFLFNQVFELEKASNYIHRVAFVHCLHMLTEVVPIDCFRKDIIPILTRLAADPVVNVRVNVAKTLQSAKNVHPHTKSELDLILSRLGSDKEEDVRDVVARSQQKM